MTSLKILPASFLVSIHTEPQNGDFGMMQFRLNARVNIWSWSTDEGMCCESTCT